VSVTVPGAAAGAVPGARPVAYRVAEVARGSRDELLVQLEGVGDRDLALALRGAELLVSREVLDPLASGEFYLADVIGCEVHGTVGGATAKHLGRVVGVGSNGPQDLLEVSEPGGTGRTWLMPAMPPFLVDFDGVRLVVDLPQGFGPEDVEEPGGA
jgi:16S rRNA processing protein RimM